MPARTPAPATLFLGFWVTGAVVAAGWLMSSFRFLEKGVELLLVVVVTEVLVEVVARLHRSDDVLLVPVAPDRRVHAERGLVHRAEGGERIEDHVRAGGAQLVHGEERRLAEFGDVRED